MEKVFPANDNLKRAEVATLVSESETLGKTLAQKTKKDILQRQRHSSSTYTRARP